MNHVRKLGASSENVRIEICTAISRLAYEADVDLHQTIQVVHQVSDVIQTVS